MPLSILIVLALVAFGAGFVSAIVGAGGTIVLPVLLATGISPLEALATNKFQSVCGTSTSALYYLRHGLIQLRTLRGAVLGCLLGSAAGTWVVQHIAVHRLEWLIPTLLIGVALYTLMSPRLRDQPAKPRISTASFAFFVATPLGFTSGFFGPGTGTFVTVALISLLGQSARQAVAQTKVLVLACNGMSLLLYLPIWQVLWTIGVLMALGQVVGARLGAQMVVHRGAALVRPMMVTVTVALSAYLIVQQL